MIKKLLLSVSFGLFVFVGNAQFKKGSVLLGGDLSFSFQKLTNANNNSPEKNSSVVFSPVFAKATKNNLFWGGSVSLGVSKTTFNTNGETNGHTIYAGVFIRKYKSILGKFNAFLQTGISAGRLTSKSERGVDYYSNSRSFNLSVVASPGISIGISKNLYLESGFSNIASLSFTHEKQDGYDFGSITDRKISSFGFSSSLSAAGSGLYFGFRIMLPK